MRNKTKNYFITTSQGQLELTKGCYLSLINRKNKIIQKQKRKNTNSKPVKTSKTNSNS